MWRRGADSDCYDANFVKSDQILQLNGFTIEQISRFHSIVVVQIVDLTYKPKFEIVRLEEAPRVVEHHFLDLRKRYGSVLAVDLVNKVLKSKSQLTHLPNDWDKFECIKAYLGCKHKL